MAEKSETKPTAAWYDKVGYSMAWLLLIQKAAWYRAEGHNEKYIVAVDTLMIILLKKERDTIKSLKKKLLETAEWGMRGKLAVYDSLLEGIVDVLEDGGWLTKDFVMESTHVQLEPDGNI